MNKKEKGSTPFLLKETWQTVSSGRWPQFIEILFDMCQGAMEKAFLVQGAVITFAFARVPV
jgi:hypothetical protein